MSYLLCDCLECPFSCCIYCYTCAQRVLSEEMSCSAGIINRLNIDILLPSPYGLLSCCALALFHAKYPVRKRLCCKNKAAFFRLFPAQHLPLSVLDWCAKVLYRISSVWMRNSATLFCLQVYTLLWVASAPFPCCAAIVYYRWVPFNLNLDNPNSWLILFSYTCSQPSSSLPGLK